MEALAVACVQLLWKVDIMRVLACRREMRDMMHRLIDSFSPVYLQPMTLSELYQRMCMNLVHIPATGCCMHDSIPLSTSHAGPVPTTPHYMCFRTAPGTCGAAGSHCSGQQGCCLARHSILSALSAALQVHTYRAKPPPATPDILKCVLELLLALSDSPDLRQMHAKVGNLPAPPTLLMLPAFLPSFFSHHLCSV